MSKKNIVYLIGAGSTHAEIINSADEPDEIYRDKNGLLISNLSKRVMKAARKTPWFKEKEKVFTSVEGSLNIELLISLFENNQIEGKYIQQLKTLIQKDIKSRLKDNQRKKFYLHKALFELHKKIEKKENLLGIISLNYDDLLDEAYWEIYNQKPNYCLTLQENSGLPLLKLHGSFNWKDIEIYGKTKTIEIIPFGINKNYLFPPYNFIWGKAFEILVKCDTLRIIGCSLSQSDIGLIDLLFKAHKERNQCITMEIIDFQPKGGQHEIKKNYGFFYEIIQPEDIEKPLIADQNIYDYDIGNPFKIWLQAKANRMIKNISNTKYIKKCFE